MAFSDLVNKTRGFRLIVPMIIMVISILTVPAKAEFRIIHKGSSDRLIVFVHGLWGDPEKSFLADGNNKSWPQMMADDNKRVRRQLPLSQYSIAVLGYPASRTDQLSIPQIASRLLTDLVDSDVLENYRVIHFVSHSLGGLVVKEILMEASGTQGCSMLITCSGIRALC